MSKVTKPLYLKGTVTAFLVVGILAIYLFHSWYGLDELKRSIMNAIIFLAIVSPILLYGASRLKKKRVKLI